MKTEKNIFQVTGKIGGNKLLKEKGKKYFSDIAHKRWEKWRKENKK